MVTEVIFKAVLAWNMLGLIVLSWIPYTRNTDSLHNIFNPKGIYNNINVNWFGCLLLTVLFNLLCPVMTICYWFVQLCTFGRKK